jgi:FdhD protein
MPRPVIRVQRSIWRANGTTEGERAIPEETAIAFTFNTASYAVMMATPQDLEDFAVGFALTEGVIPSLDAIESIDVVEEDVGIELRLWLKAQDAAEFLETLIEAMRPPPPVGKGLALSPNQIMEGVSSLFPRQDLNRETRAVHAAGFWEPERGLVALREDVGRHNALDKLAGALARDGATAEQGLVVLTSRVSIEMVQKSAAIGAPIVAAVSAPTALAVRMAEACGMTLIAIARKDGFEIFTHPHRVKGTLESDVA